MDSRYCTFINGKEIPIWVVKKPEERTDWEQFMAKMWHEVCLMARDFIKDPESWRERIKHPDHTWYWEDIKGIYFNKYISDDFVMAQLKGPYKELDNKEKSPLPGYSLRQIIDSLFSCAFDKIGKERPPKY